MSCKSAWYICLKCLLAENDGKCDDKIILVSTDMWIMCIICTAVCCLYKTAHDLYVQEYMCRIALLKLHLLMLKLTIYYANAQYIWIKMFEIILRQN